MEKLSYKLPAFEGPLDLLLYLVSKNKLNIFDIQISELVDQYTEHIDVMKEQNMDITSEFLEMAARLIYIKTVYLLPKHEEADELKKELSGQLIEYQQCKQIAKLMASAFNYDIFVRQPAEIDFDQTYRRNHSPMEIYAAYQNAVGRGKRFEPPPEKAFSAIVKHKVVSVTSKIVFVLRRLWKKDKINYNSLFYEEKQTKSDLVATFLAVLELVKVKRVRVEGEKQNTTVKLINGGVKSWRLKKFKEQ